jgi:hypothetical protein
VSTSNEKKFVELFPHDPADLAAADQHYLDVHFRFAAATFQSVDAVRAYHTNRAVGQFELTGGFSATPDAWRFAITQWADGGDEHHVGWLEPQVRDLFFADRLGHIAGVQSWEVDEEVVVDRRSGQLTSVKFLFRYPIDRYPSAGAFAAQYRTEHLPRLMALAAAAPGLRLFLTNTVTREAESRERAGGGSEYTGAFVAEASMLCFEELWFDSELAADQFFRCKDVLAVLRDGPSGKAVGYRVEERCGIDRR